MNSKGVFLRGGGRAPTKAITIWQPWASMLACGVKQYETRSWATSYRGPIAIHAAAISIQQVLKKCFPMSEWVSRPDYEAKMQFLDAVAKDFAGVYPVEELLEFLNHLPTGAVIATTELVNVWPIVQLPGLDVSAARLISVGKKRLATGRQAPDFGGCFVPSKKELAFGNWTPGRYAWEFSKMRIIKPIPAKGKQGLWNWGE